MNYQNMLRYATLAIELKDLRANHSDDPDPLTEFYARLDASRSALSPAELKAVALLVGKSSLCLHCHYGHQRIILGEASGELGLEAVCSDGCASALLSESEGCPCGDPGCNGSCVLSEEYCPNCNCFED